jgi:cell division protein FtsI (penicillin-binding protein 3)
MRRKRDSNIRWFMTIGLVFSGFIVLLARLVSLQVVSAEDLSKRAERQREKGVEIEAERGNIFDRAGRILATSVDVPSLYALPALIAHPREDARRLARVLGMDPSEVAKSLRSKRSFVWIKRKMDPGQAAKIERLEIPGVGFLHESQRFYPKRFLAGQALGFAGVDSQGLEGVEFAFDSVLRGEKGLVILERDAGGRPVFPKGLEYSPLARGRDIVLTLDEVIQHIAERELGAAMERSEAVSGSVIVMDPNTGEILAMASRPEFNPNRIRGHRPEHWRNRTITDTFEPGSTFKIVVAAAALEEAVAGPADLYFCENGAFSIGKRVIHDHLKHGYLTFSQVFQKSSNIGTAKIAMALGDEKLHEYAARFGFGQATGIDLRGEAPGVLRPPGDWTALSVPSVAIGQEVAVTPLQMTTAYAAVANGGWLVRPRLVSEIRDQEGRVVTRFDPEIRRRVIRSETARELVHILEGTVREGGTAEAAALSGYPVSGKTGTAQKMDPSTGRYSRHHFISSFIGIAPSNAPRIVVSVVVDSPKGESWGGVVAGPVFRRVSEQTLRYLGVTPSAQDRLALAAP